MAWHGLEEHDHIVEQFRRAIARDRLAHVYMFTGPAGVGKRRFALLLAKSLFCRERSPQLLDPCGHCRSCRLIGSEAHPDLLLVAKPEDRAELPLELLIGGRQERGQEGVCRRLALTPQLADRRFLIIDDADYLNPEGANALLKTLEEPPPGAIIVLLATSLAKQLPTIRSRCQVVRFRPLSRRLIVRLLSETLQLASRAEAERVALYSGGSMQVAMELLEPRIWESRTELCEHLSRYPLPIVPLGELISDFVTPDRKKDDSDADADGSKRGQSVRARNRLRYALLFAADFFWRTLGWKWGIEDVQNLPYDPDVLKKSLKAWHAEDRLLAAAERTVLALDHLERNVNRSVLILSWLDDLAKIQLGTTTGVLRLVSRG